jgi:hypothetical protein
MATNYTNLLGFALPTTGELSGTWGQVVNDSITELVEDSIAGSATASVTSGDWTLTTTGSGASNQARCAILIPTGSPGTTRNIIAPSSSKAYIVDNQSDGAVVVKGSATSGTSIAAGARAVVAWNGSDFVTISTSATDGVSTISFGSTGLTPSTGTSGAVTVGGTLAVGSGGTGATTLTDGNVLFGSGGSAVDASSLLSKSAAVTSGTYVKSIGYADTVVALGNTGTAINLDVVSGGVFTATLTGSATITLRYPVASGSSSFVLILTNDGTAGRTVAWAGGSFLWPNGAASLSRTTTANATDVWVFFTPNGGTTWYGNITMKNLTA